MSIKFNLGTLSAYELIDLLDKKFPHRCIEAEQSATDAHRYAGKRDLIDYLLKRREREEDHAYRQTEITVR